MLTPSESSTFMPYSYIQNSEGIKGYLDSKFKNYTEINDPLFTLKNYSFDDMKNDNKFYKTEFKIIGDNNNEIQQTIDTNLYYCPATKLLYNENKEVIDLYKIMQESSKNEYDIILYSFEFSEELTGKQNECELILHKIK